MTDFLAWKKQCSQIYNQKRRGDKREIKIEEWRQERERERERRQKEKDKILRVRKREYIIFNVANPRFLKENGQVIGQNVM